MRVSLFAAFVSLAIAATFQLGTAHEPDGAHGSQSVFDKKLVSTRITVSDILNNHGKYDAARAHTKLFEAGATLVYVTPWNNHGYDVVKYFKGKFDFVSPVWYKVQRVGEQRYELTGGHDVDKGWMEEVRGRVNDKLVGKIVPRFQFHGWSREDLVALVQNESEAKALADVLAEECKKHDFNGLVLESGIPTYLPVFFGLLAGQLHGYGRELIVVIPPNREGSLQLLTQETFKQLASVADYLSLMTYDYSSSKPTGGPNAPIDWMEENIDDITNDSNRRKLLLGLNMYGMDFSPRDEPQAVVGNQVLEILRGPGVGTINWDKESEEHWFEYKDPQGVSHQVWTPTLKVGAGARRCGGKGKEDVPGGADPPGGGLRW
ncbi:chitinase domain-containing protein 1 precursor [Jimgerdemannia flammicorona]|uniref:Chitinase domain-containing protein 1 n=1 Tax=Jimgerdemannia flammicorona TaxID=994334 RepID=A0A433A198_9FUNG|nr:chitinase domain-containing protein 1 precursor [Jimgerdemannia flammicorona]